MVVADDGRSHFEMSDVAGLADGDRFDDFWSTFFLAKALRVSVETDV